MLIKEKKNRLKIIEFSLLAIVVLQVIAFSLLNKSAFSTVLTYSSLVNLMMFAVIWSNYIESPTDNSDVLLSTIVAIISTVCCIMLNANMWNSTAFLVIEAISAFSSFMLGARVQGKIRGSM